MKAGSWYICGFVVTFVYFYVYAINHIRGEIHGGPRRGHHPQPPYSRNNREVGIRQFSVWLAATISSLLDILLTHPDVTVPVSWLR